MKPSSSLLASAALAASFFVASSATAQAQSLSAEGTDASSQPAEAEQAPIASASTGRVAAGPAAVNGDIVVTAQKRSQRLQDVPITIQAISASNVASRRIDTIARISNVAPSVEISGVSNQKPVLYIRGIGTRSYGPAADQSVGVFLDDFYAGDASQLFSGLSDVEQIEVLKGPQGTLYGRNTIAGAISIVTKGPSETPEGQFEASLGNYNLVSAKGSVSGPLIGDTVLGRLSFYGTKRDGYMRNEVTDGPGGLGQDQAGLRAKVLIHANDRLSATITGDFGRDTSPGQLGKNQGPGIFLKRTTLPVLPIDPNPDHSAANVDPTTDATNWGVNARVQWQGDAITLLSLSQYRHGHFHNDAELDASAYNIVLNDQRQTEHNISQEFRITSAPSGPASLGGRLDWIAGVFFYHSRADALDGFAFGQDSFPAQLSGKSSVNDTIGLGVRGTSLAAYGEATFHITDRLSLTGGLRYSHDSKNGEESGTTDTPGVPLVPANYAVPVSLRSHSTDPKVVLSYKPVTGILAYASYSTGYKSGGFQYLATTAFGASQAYGPENVRYYEVGIKTQFLDRRATLNVSSFRGDYKGLQLTSIVVSTPVTSNAASVNLRGIEAEGRFAITHSLSINASYTYLDNKFRNYNNCANTAIVGCPIFNGTRLPRSPKNQVIVGGEYKILLSDNSDLTFGTDLTYKSKTILQEGGFGAVLQNVGPVATLNPLLVEPSTKVLDARVSYRRDRWIFSVWGTNLTNAHYADAFAYFPASTTPLGTINNSMIRFFAPPRMFGATVGYSF